MTELNHNLRGLALGGIRRFTTLAQERGDCILLTLGEPEFDTPGPIRQACKDALDRGRTPLHRKPGRPGPAPGHLPVRAPEPGPGLRSRGNSHYPGGHGGHLHRPHRRPQSGG